MKCTQIQHAIANLLNTFEIKYPEIMQVVKSIHEAGGRALLVGGVVRDSILYALQKDTALPESKDIDIEVHGLPLDTLESILQKHGPVSLVGKSFGVLRVHGINADWSVPRSDSSGRKPEVRIDPSMSYEQAFSRRDLTMNALGIDLITGELIDPFDGVADIKNGILRAPDEKTFAEDPLRLFRVMQFISRFQMKPDHALNELCKKIDIHTVSRERIEQEFKKMFLRSSRPSLGIRWLQAINRLNDIAPELVALIGVKQPPEHHPEGDVFEHTMQAVDAAAQHVYESEEHKLIVLYGALCHDLGKATTTEFKDGKWRAHGHESAGISPTKKLLKRITREKMLLDAIPKLVKYHLVPYQLVESDAGPHSYKRLANKLAPDATLAMLADVARADKLGRNGTSSLPLKKEIPNLDVFIQRAKAAQVMYKPEEQVLQGRDIIDIVEPGPQMGQMLRAAYEIQIEEGIQDKTILKQRILKR